MGKTEKNDVGRGDSFRVVLAYAVFAALWILLSDRAVGLLFSDPDSLVQASMAKGWFFVAVTSLMLYVLVRRLVGQIDVAYQRELELMREQQYVPAMLEAIADSTDDAIFVKDLAGRYLLFNQAAARFVGKTVNDVLGQDDRALFPPEQAAMLMDIGRRVIESGNTETNEVELHTPEGTKVFLATKGLLRDNEGRRFGIFGISRDITARKRTEDAIKASERRFHDIVDASADWVWEVDAGGRYSYASDSVERLLGYTPAEVIGKTPFDFMPPTEAARVRAEFGAFVADKTPFRDLDNINLHKDGSLRHVWTTGVPILAADGTLLGYRGLDRDITERKQAEDKLRLWAEAFDRSGLAAAIVSPHDNTFMAVNATFARERGHAPEELLGKSIMTLYTPEQVAAIRDRVAAVDVSGHDTFETEHVGKDGRRIPVLLDVTVLKSHDGKPQMRVAYAINIAARKAAEEELKARNAELEHFNRATIGRELDMIKMKETINALNKELGRAPPYDMSFTAESDRMAAL